MNTLHKYYTFCFSLIASLASAQTVTIEGVIRVGKDWTEVSTSVVNAETGTTGVASKVLFEVTTQSVLTSAATSTYYNVEVDKTAGTTPSKYLRLATDAVAKGGLILTAGAVNLNSKAFTLNNPAASAITFASGTGIFAETASTDVNVLGGTPGLGYGYVKWIITNTSGVYTVPFITATGADVRLTYDVTVAGNAGGQINFSTYGTTPNNKPWASGVTQFDAGGADGSAKVANRYYIVEQNSYSTRPKGWLTFKYLMSELDATITENRLAAQRFNTGRESWGDWLYSPTANTTTKTVSIFMANNADYFDSWVLSDQDHPLPIELLSFDAKPNSSSVDLTWTTASEVNSDYFTIEKTVDGSTFQDVATVKAAGFSNNYKSYNTTDNLPYEGLSYYRLKATDLDGKVDYSELKPVQFNKTLINTGINVFPNPVKEGTFNVELLGFLKESAVEIQVQDLSGRVIYSYLATVTSEQLQKITFNNLKFAPGVYILKTNSGSESYSKKIIVE